MSIAICPVCNHLESVHAKDGCSGQMTKLNPGPCPCMLTTTALVKFDAVVKDLSASASTDIKRSDLAAFLEKRLRRAMNV